MRSKRRQLIRRPLIMNRFTVLMMLSYMSALAAITSLLPSKAVANDVQHIEAAAAQQKNIPNLKASVAQLTLSIGRQILELAQAEQAVVGE